MKVDSPHLTQRSRNTLTHFAWLIAISILYGAILFIPLPPQLKRQGVFLADELLFLDPRAGKEKAAAAAAAERAAAEATEAARKEAVRVGGKIKPPTKTKNVTPEYPEAARSARVQGMVIVEAVIGADGKVADAKVLRSVPQLDAAAVAAVKQWEFTPTLLNGKAVPVVMTVTVNFKLK